MRWSLIALVGLQRDTLPLFGFGQGLLISFVFRDACFGTISPGDSSAVGFFLASLKRLQ